MRRAATTEAINNLLQAIGRYGFDGVKIDARDVPSALATICHDTPRHTLVRYTKELRRQELVDVTIRGETIHLRLTIKAMYRVQRLAIDSLQIIPPDVWDRCWHMVMFDIPSRHKESRYLLTSQLRRLGFVILQSSCWAHPYPCHDVIRELVTYLNLQSFVTIADVQQFDAATTARLRRAYPGLVESIALP